MHVWDNIILPIPGMYSGDVLVNTPPTEGFFS